MAIETIDRGTAGNPNDTFKIGVALDTAQANDEYLNAEVLLRAPIADPTFTGDPKAPTPSLSDDSTSIATTAYVQNEFDDRDFATVAALALASLPVGRKISTKGCLSVGDGGHGTFIVEAASGTPDGYSRILLANGNHAVLQKPWNALQFGASVDGVTDSGSLITSALTKAQAKLDLVKPNIGDEYQFDTDVTLGGLDAIGGKYHLEVTTNSTAPVHMAASFSSVENMRINQENDAEYAIEIDGVAPDYFGNHIHGVKLTGLKGINNAGLESKFSYLYMVGNGATTVGGTGINITQFDTSLHSCILEDYYRGVTTTKGLQAYDLHIVSAGRALSVTSQGQPSQFVNTYLDTSYEVGLQLIDQSGACFVNTQLLNTGELGVPANSFGMTLDANSSYNLFVNTVFAQPVLADVTGLIKISTGAVNNTFVGVTGDYKMASADIDEFRKQTVVGCSEGWARHNNVPRKTRVRAVGVAAAGTANMVFTLDWDYPAASNNFWLFTGYWSSRAPSTNDGGYGTVQIVIANTVNGVANVITKLSGAAAVSWSISSASLSGNQLTVVVQNNDAVSANISMELERSIDPSGLSY